MQLFSKTPSEKDIIAGCVQGKAKYQSLLYEKYGGKMFATCLRYASDYHSAEDVLQEGFIKVYSNIEKYRNEGSFEGWMRRIFVNTAIELIRKNTAFYELSETDTSNGEWHTPLENGFDGLAAQDLMDIIQSLSVGYRTIFNLYAIEGYTHKEIAELLNINEGTSKSQLARARYLLQKRLEEQYKQKEGLYVETTSHR